MSACISKPNEDGRLRVLLCAEVDATIPSSRGFLRCSTSPKNWHLSGCKGLITADQPATRPLQTSTAATCARLCRHMSHIHALHEWPHTFSEAAPLFHQDSSVPTATAAPFRSRAFCSACACLLASIISMFTCNAERAAALDATSCSILALVSELDDGGMLTTPTIRDQQLDKA